MKITTTKKLTLSEEEIKEAIAFYVEHKQLGFSLEGVVNLNAFPVDRDLTNYNFTATVKFRTEAECSTKEDTIEDK